DLHAVPLMHFYISLVFIRFDKPASPVGFIDTSGIKAGRSYFCLPSWNFPSFYGTMEKNATISVFFLFKMYGKEKVFIGLISSKIAILLIRSAFTYQGAICIYIPFFCTIDLPSL